MLASAEGGFGNGKNKSLNVDKQPINMDVLLTTLSSLGGVKVPKILEQSVLLKSIVEKGKEIKEKKILEPCTETLCSNTKCDRNDEAKVKNNPNIPHSPGYSHDRGGKVIEVDCDKQKNK